MPKPVMVESPYAEQKPGERQTFDAYLARAIRHSLDMHEAPFASHGFYPHYLNDESQFERQLGMVCGQTWMMVGAQLVAVYGDYGISPGMKEAMELADHWQIPIVHRLIGRNE